MAQQPNVERSAPADRREKSSPGPAKTWRSDKVGVPTRPEEVPTGGGFGGTGPDPGWGLRLVREAELPDDDPNLGSVVSGLVLARAAASGRAPVPEDIEAALALCGYGEDAPDELIERRRRWLAAAPHDKRPGATAVSEVDRELIVNKPEQIRLAYRLTDQH